MCNFYVRTGARVHSSWNGQRIVKLYDLPFLCLALISQWGYAEDF